MYSYLMFVSAALPKRLLSLLPLPKPVIKRDEISWPRLNEEAWIAAPTTMMQLPMKIVLLRPNMLPANGQLPNICKLPRKILTKPDRSNSAKETSQRISAYCDALNVRSCIPCRRRAGALDIDLGEVSKEAR
jgi:hypothetical protein